MWKALDALGEAFQYLWWEKNAPVNNPKVLQAFLALFAAWSGGSCDADLATPTDVAYNSDIVIHIGGAMSNVLSMRLKEGQMERLRRIARQLGRTPSEAGARLLEEGLRRNDFAFIDFRDSPVGRQAYVHGSSLAVWEVVMVARCYDLDPERTAEHLSWTVPRARAALNYAAAFPEEIEAALRDHDARDFAGLSRLLPQAELFLLKDTPFEEA